MNEVDKKELRRLAEVIVSKGPRQDECTRAMTVEPSAILSLLDELDEKDRAIDLWSQKAQRISDELEQYRKDAERWRYYSRRLSPMVGAEQELINSTVDGAIERDAKDHDE